MAILQGGALLAGSGSPAVAFAGAILGWDQYNPQVFAGTGAVVLIPNQILHNKSIWPNVIAGAGSFGGVPPNMITGMLAQGSILIGGSGYIYPYPASRQVQALNVNLPGAGSIAAALSRTWFGATAIAGQSSFVSPLSDASISYPVQFLASTLPGAGSFATPRGIMQFGPSPLLAGAGGVAISTRMPNIQASAILAGTGSGMGSAVMPYLHIYALLSNVNISALQATLSMTYRMQARLGGIGAFAPSVYTPAPYHEAALIEGAGGFGGFAVLYREASLQNVIFIGAILEGDGEFFPDLYLLVSDRINPDIDEHAGSELLYRSATGMEKAMADIGAYGYTSIYAELVRDQWDPYQISYRNLPYLAWAVGVNLWEDNWTEEFKRYWVANQWTFKAQRGSLVGIKNFVEAVNGEVIHAIVPPATFYPEPAYSDEERAAYVARFPQLRLYPYSPAPKLPWLCYLGRFPDKPAQPNVGEAFTLDVSALDGPDQLTPVQEAVQTTEPVMNHNGSYLPMYPTNYNAGSDYQRACTLYDPATGIETPLTVRTIQLEGAPGENPYADQIILPIKGDTHYYMGQTGKWALPAGYDAGVDQNTRFVMNQNNIFLGNSPDVSTLTINIPRDGSLDTAEAKAIYTTINPGMKNINVQPDQKSLVHQAYPSEFYCGQPLIGKFLPVSNAWQYMYEVWYLLDPTRLPDYKKAYTFMGRARFGEHKYTAELKIKKFGRNPRFYMYYGGYMGGYMAPPDTSTIDSLRRAVTASMALRDTIYIDTLVRRVVEVGDSVMCDGSTNVGQMIDSY